MSSYTDVKNLIISNIKANGQREITGPILQDVLLNMLENSSEAEEITYNDLKALRDQDKLTPSRLYRIIDYVTTTTQSNTRSAGHPFDVIVLALSESELSEQVWATQRTGDTYFANSDLGAWQIWYCLDNDTGRFAWADSANSKGVIYRMIDEFGNDCPYDFKNIQFYRKWNATKSLWSTISSDNTGIPCYTFSSSGNSSTTSFTDMSLVASNNVYSNVIGKYVNSNKQTLNNNCFFGDYCSRNTFGNNCYRNTFGNNCYSNTFGNNCYRNTFGNNCYSNTFGDYCQNNSFGNYCSSNTFGNNCQNNTFRNDCSRSTFGNNCQNNTFGNYCQNNSFGEGCGYNAFGNNCQNNAFGEGCNNNTFGNNCQNNAFGNNCQNNDFGNDCYSNALGNSCWNNAFGNNCQNNAFGNNCNNNAFVEGCWNNAFGNNCQNNTFGNNCSSNTFGNDCCSNALGNSCWNNAFGNNCQNNAFGNGCGYNTFGNGCAYIVFAETISATLKYHFYQNNHFGNGCRYILFKGAGTAGWNEQVQNYNFAQGLQGTSSAYLTIDGKRNLSYETYVSKDTDGTIKESVIAEFENKLGNCVDLTTEQTINATKTFSAGIDLNGTRISKVGSPINTDDAANKEYVDGTVKTVDDKVNDFKNAGYLYAGVATTATNPGTSDTKVFYIANGKGKYPNFSGLDVTEDDVVILYYDTVWHKVATGIASNEKLADLPNYAHKDEVRHIERDLGMYPELEPVPLNPEVTGKYINSDGKYVDASGWNVASIGAVYLGNTYLLNMVSSANMVLGVALFVSRVYKRDKEGKIIGTTLTPLFSANNTSIPASGYVLFEAMDDYDEVLICYKPELTTQMLVARWGFKASHATQLRNLRLIVDNKTDFEGIYELLTAGYALNLVGKGNGEPQAFMSRKTGGGNITDGSAVIKEVDGVQPIVWNQMVQNGNTELSNNKADPREPSPIFYRVGSSSSIIDWTDKLGLITAIIVANTSGSAKIYISGSQTNIDLFFANNIIAGHKYLVSFDVTANDVTTVGGYKHKNRKCFDLTKMFGAGNEPSTYEEYLDRISHYHIEDTYAYNAGEVVNYKGVGIRTTNIDGTKTYVRDWSEVMRKYFPDGMTSLNGVKDFFDDKKAVRKYGVVDLGEFEWYAYSANRFRTRTDIEDIKLTDSTTVANIFAPNYKAVRKEWVEQEDMQISVDGRYIMVCRRSVADATALKAAMQGVKLYYELSEPVEDIFEKPLNLTYTVINGGTETSLATENSTQFEGSIAYNKDYVAVVDELQMQNRVIQIEFENWEN